ncbi:MAG TPA: RdgB/HAM1 family non-canonical purine NTP pyrophosphatase [Terriglobales bacterium]|nr:RdgB/HAM1 family non-canonical purine NTP pyrophosphatase [Terriglobales bacterium]
MATILVATSNAGKLRDFAAAAAEHGVAVCGLPNFSSLPQVPEDEPTFEANAQKKAEFYSRFAAGAIVLADDSGLEVWALSGAPGVRSARYAATSAEENASDAANNARLLSELESVPEDERHAQFVCVIAAARDGKVLATFRGEAQGVILHAPRGSGGFGYDPLFYFPGLGKTFAELSAAEKARVSHRGQAFRKFLDWMERQE